LRNAEKLNAEAFNLFKEQKYDLSNITHGEEINLVKFLSLYPETILQAGTRAEPHRIVYYLNELAGYFHSLWNYGRDNPDLRFITENVEQTASKLALLGALRYVIASGLELCNVEPLEEM
jgi:arginyl-tRNA synthetase